jgi:hypothetical protein
MIRIFVLKSFAVVFLIGGIFGWFDKERVSKQIAVIRFPISYLLFVHASQIQKGRKVIVSPEEEKEVA